MFVNNIKTITRNVMKAVFSFILLVFSSITISEEINPKNWLLWHSLETELPFHSALFIYPPFTLYAENDSLKGFIAAPYSIGGENNRMIEQFLIAVTDSKNQTHFLKPKLDSVGIIDDTGIGTSLLYSDTFTNGKVLIQLYRANSPKNRQLLSAKTNENTERQKGIEKALTKINLSQPETSKTWSFKANTIDGQNIDDIVSSSTYSIFQIYSQFCGFCKKAIPTLNALNNTHQVTVIGMVGTDSLIELKDQLINDGVQYPFIAYEAEYAQPALMEATGQTEFPTYVVLNSSRKVLGIFVGTDALKTWLNYQEL